MMRVLIIEDHAPVAKVLGALLQTTGCLVHIVPDMRGAWEVLRAYTFDVVTLDLDLPDSPIEKTLGQIPTLIDYCPKVIVMTGSLPERVQTRALEAGAVACLYKADLCVRDKIIGFISGR